MPIVRLTPILVLTIASVSGVRVVAQDQSRAPDLSFWTVGSEGVARRFGVDLYQTLQRERAGVFQILLAIADRPLTEDLILERTGLPKDRLRDLIYDLNALHVIRNDDRGRWATTVPVITDSEAQRIRERLTATADGVARHIQGELPQLLALYDRVKALVDPPWSDAAHLVVDKFVIDGTFHSAMGRLERERDMQRYYDRDQRIIPAFFVERGEHFSSFGSNWYPFTRDSAQREVYVLHGSVYQRYDIRMNAYRQDSRFSAALFSIPPAGGIASLTDQQRDILTGLGWIEGGRLMVPVVQASTIKSLGPTLEKIGTGAAEAVFENQSVIMDAFTSSPYAEFLDARGDYVQACYHILFGLVIEQLARVGVVPAFPDPVPEYFGVYLVIGKLF